MQDFIEERMKKKIKNELNPNRKRWLEWDLHCWIQNGRPVFGDNKNKRFLKDGHGHRDNLYTHHSKSDRTAYEDLNEEKRKKRIL